MFNILGQENKFEKYATVVANSYLDDEVPLNDSIVKLAEEKELNPEQIKRVVEAANVKVFQKHFSDEDREGHKDVDFDVADPVVIMKRIYIVKKPSESKKDSIDHDFSPLDFFKDLAKDSFHDREDSEVDDLPQPKQDIDRPTLVIRIKTAKANLEKKAYIASEQYVEKVASLAKKFRTSGSDPKAFDTLCKEAFDHRGPGLNDVLQSIATQAKKEVPSFEKHPMCKVAGYPSPELEQLFELEKIAYEYKRCESAAQLADEQLKDMEK